MASGTRWLPQAAAGYPGWSFLSVPVVPQTLAYSKTWERLVLNCTKERGDSGKDPRASHFLFLAEKCMVP